MKKLCILLVTTLLISFWSLPVYADAARDLAWLIGQNNARGWVIGGIDRVQSATTTSSGSRIVLMESGDAWRIPSTVLPPLPLTDVIIFAKAGQYVLLMGNDACEALYLRDD